VVLDRSGSMQGEKLSHACRALERLIADLKASDRLALASYADGVYRHSNLLSMTDANRRFLTEAVERIRASGGTNPGGGLQAGIEKKTWSRVVLENDYDRLKPEIAADIRDGEKKKALRRLESYRQQQVQLSAVVGSTEVQRNLEQSGWRFVRGLRGLDVPQVFQIGPELIRNLDTDFFEFDAQGDAESIDGRVADDTLELFGTLDAVQGKGQVDIGENAHLIGLDFRGDPHNEAASVVVNIRDHPVERGLIDAGSGRNVAVDPRLPAHIGFLDAFGIG
jgi:hypothetical protein